MFSLTFTFHFQCCLFFVSSQHFKKKKKMLDGHSCVVWQSRAYIWGGKEESTAEGGPVYYSNTVYSFDPAQCAQAASVTLERVRLLSGDSTMAVTPEGRAYHSSVLYG